MRVSQTIFAERSLFRDSLLIDCDWARFASCFGDLDQHNGGLNQGLVRGGGGSQAEPPKETVGMSPVDHYRATA